MGGFISFFLSIGSVFWPVLSLIRKKFTTDISYYVNNGVRCYECKEKVENSDPHGYNYDDWGIGQRRLCEQCRLDESLNDVLDNKNIYTKSKKILSNFIYSRNWNKSFLILCLISVALQTVAFFVNPDVKFWLQISGGLIIFIAQFFAFLNYRKFTIKKTKS